MEAPSRRQSKVEAEAAGEEVIASKGSASKQGVRLGHETCFSLTRPFHACSRSCPRKRAGVRANYSVEWRKKTRPSRASLSAGFAVPSTPTSSNLSPQHCPTLFSWPPRCCRLFCGVGDSINSPPSDSLCLLASPPPHALARHLWPCLASPPLVCPSHGQTNFPK
ncbi:unnamed protein product [Protopolystoma xenopodis]|uniref:Uncharacterized protein n=1 Tax=Protopolystoma xenopodis TaxID=117903 RepID=A0A3S5BTA9_9PLAT|nr:unnamed protein product [Protopolystoma xenopodis]